MTQWRAESERWRRAHDKIEFELRSNRDFIDRVRAYLDKKGLHEDFVHFLLATHMGDEEATKFLADSRESARIARAKDGSNPPLRKKD